MLGATPHQVYGEFDQGSSRGGGEEGKQERQLGHTVPAGHHELDDPGTDADMLVPLQGQHVCMSGLFNLGSGLSLRAC